jgi:hypothetical protein
MWIGRVLAIVVGIGLVGYGIFLYRAPDHVVQPTVSPAAPSTAPSTAPEATGPALVLDHGEVVPANGTTISVTVPEGELRIITGAPVCVDGKCFRAGETRGAVVAMLPRASPYNVTGLITKGNWLGFYTHFDGTDKQIQPVVDELVAGIHRSGSCTGGRGCATVHVMTVGANGVVNEYVSAAKPIPSGG